MLKHIGYKYRIYPTVKQEQLIVRNFAASRITYNTALHLKNEHYKVYKENRKISVVNDLQKEHPWLKECDSNAISHSLRNLDTAFQNFFKKKSKFPKFKKKLFAASYQTKGTTQKSGICSIRIEGNRIKLPKIGFVKMVYHREVPENSKIKTVTVSRNAAGQFFVSLCLEFEVNDIIPSIPDKNKFLGLDMAMHGLFVSSDKEFEFDYSNSYKSHEKKLGKLQRALSRKNKGSNNYYKWKYKIAALNNDIVNIQDYELNEISTRIADEYDAVCVEDINLQNMGRHKKGGKFCFGKSIKNNSFGKFRTMLEYKLEERGKLFIKVPQFFASSQLCSCCGYQNPETKNLSVREWTCPKCGTHHDRDFNAAINIRDKGYEMYINNEV